MIICAKWEHMLIKLKVGHQFIKDDVLFLTYYPHSQLS